MNRRSRLALTAALTAATAALIGTATSVQAQDCRDNLGGNYIFAHSGKKPDGRFFSSLAMFSMRPATGRFDVHALINKRSVGVFPVDSTDHAFVWLDGCVLYLDRPGFIGVVSDDGSVISLATFDDEQMAGVAIRYSK